MFESHKKLTNFFRFSLLINCGKKEREDQFLAENYFLATTPVEFVFTKGSIRNSSTLR